jgi:5'-3' exoribonuclease 1
MQTDGYLNESGTINTKRLQAVLDEMVQWEQEVFEREYSDLNWYKGKQRRHVQEPKQEKKHSKGS